MTREGTGAPKVKERGQAKRRAEGKVKETKDEGNAPGDKNKEKENTAPETVQEQITRRYG